MSGTRLREGEVLVVDDDRGICDCMELLLGRAGLGCVIARRGADGLALLRSREFDLVLTDLRLPDASGLDIVAESKALHPQTQVILMTSFSSVESAVEALRRGADDYVIKPFDNDDLMFSIERALGTRRMRQENAALKRSLRKATPQGVIIGQSESVLRLQTLIRRVAATDANVLILGESGTGKELVAQAIHAGGSRGDRPFVAVNCGAIPADLIESELFGHAKGAYTGATAASDGLIREAGGGTLLLDEISEMPLQVQVKLLRVLQERQVRPLGSSQSFLTDARFVAASNRNLKEAAESGQFRADLYYRLNVIAIHVPPLRERGPDVVLLAQHFLQQHSRRLSSRVTGMDDAFIAFLHRHSWPGNVRELQNVIERAVILADGPVLTVDDLGELALGALDDARPELGEPGLPLSVEDYIREVITLYQDRHGEAELAQMLGIGRKALWARRRSWGLYREGRRGRSEDAGEPVHGATEAALASRRGELR